MKNPYADIIRLPHHVSDTRPQMPRENRAAQFAPFSALTGYEDALDETARLTGERIELGESAAAELDRKLALLAENADMRPEVAVTYFVPDGKKPGGAYVTVVGRVKRIDEVERAIVFADGSKIAIAEVLELESEAFGTEGG